MPAHSINKQLDENFVNGLNRVDDPGASGTIEFDTPMGYAVCLVTTAAAESRALQSAARFGVGQLFAVILSTDGGDLTITGAEASVVLSDAGDVALFVVSDNAGTKAWRIVGTTKTPLVDLDGVADALVLDADGDTTLSSPTDDQIDVEVGGTDRLTFTSAGAVLAAASSYGGQGSTHAPVVPIAAQQALSGAGAVNITTFYTAWTTTGANAGTLADGAQKGQLKKIQMVADAGDGTLTPSNLSGGTTITFADVGDYALLMFDGTNWVALELGNDADGVTAPVLA